MRCFTVAFLIAALCSLPTLRAQEAPSPGGPPPASTAPPPTDDEKTYGSAGTLKVRVNLVNTYFSVRDKGGYLTGLHKEDCQVYENKEPQTIRSPSASCWTPADRSSRFYRWRRTRALPF